MAFFLYLLSIFKTKNMKKIILICLTMFLLISCNSDDIVIDGFNYDAILNISVTNTKGDDLLNPDNSNAIAQSKIKILYLVKGKLIQESNGTDYPRNFMIYKQDGLNIIRVFLNSSAEEQYPQTYIQWSEDNTDIIKIEYNRTSNSVTKKTIWLNDKLVSDIEPYLKVIK
jgi:hypothetical protein